MNAKDLRQSHASLFSTLKASLLIGSPVGSCFIFRRYKREGIDLIIYIWTGKQRTFFPWSRKFLPRSNPRAATPNGDITVCVFCEALTVEKTQLQQRCQGGDDHEQEEPTTSAHQAYCQAQREARRHRYTCHCVIVGIEVVEHCGFLGVLIHHASGKAVVDPIPRQPGYKVSRKHWESLYHTKEVFSRNVYKIIYPEHPRERTGKRESQHPSVDSSPHKLRGKNSTNVHTGLLTKERRHAHTHKHKKQTHKPSLLAV